MGEADQTGRTQPVSANNDQRMLKLLQNISLAVAQAETINDAFKNVLNHICRFMAWPLGHVYIWSEAANALVSSHIWYTEDASTILPFRELSETTQFHRGEGTLGQVWVTGEAITILDVHDSSVFVRQMPAEEEGVRAYFAFPIMIDGEVTAVLEFFSPEAVPPDQDMTSVINHVSALLGLAMQRQQMVAQLQQSEAQLAEAQQTAHIGHWEWDLKENEITWSPELYRIYGLNFNTFEPNYESNLNFVHPDDVDYVKKKVAEAQKRGQPFNFFHRIVRTDGTERVINARGRPIYDRVGQIIKLYGTVQDMTEQKEVEIKLAQSVRQLSALMDIGQAIAATLDLEQIYERVLTLVRPLIGAEAIILFLYQDKMLVAVASDQDDVIDLQGVRVSPKSGIVGEVWQRGHSVLIKSSEEGSRFSKHLIRVTGYQPTSMLATPVRWRDKAVGVLEAIHRQPNAFNEEDLRLLETIAAWTAIAIGNAQQYKQLQRRLSESDAIATISNALTETLEPDKLLKLIVTMAQEIIPNADWATIHLLQYKTKQLELAASAGLNLNKHDYSINFGEGIAGHVMSYGGVVNVADVQNDPRRLPVDLNTHARSLLVAPVESRQRRLGTISVQCATPSIFKADDERLITILGIQLGVALENARLYSSQRRARERAERQRERMRHMARRVVRAQEAERARIARELHDESGQSLTSLKISLDLIRSILPKEMADIRESLDDVLDLADKTMSNLRLLSHNLRPPGLDVYGLDAALVGLCQDFETHTKIKVSYNGCELPGLAELTSLSLYRFAQEAITNAAKHAAASEIEVTMSKDDGLIKLEIADNGVGFTPPDLEEHIPSNGGGAGLLGMVERLEMVDGRLEIKSNLDEGSRLTAVVPYTTEAS